MYIDYKAIREMKCQRKSKQLNHKIGKRQNNVLNLSNYCHNNNNGFDLSLMGIPYTH